MVVGDNVGTAVVGGAVVGAAVVGAAVVGAAVVGAAVVGATVVGGAVVVSAAVLGGAYLGAVVAVIAEVGKVVVGGALMAVRGEVVVVVVELVEPLTVPGTSACAVRVIEPKSRLSLAFSASRFVSRCIWTASSCLSTAIAAVSPAVDASVASGGNAFPSMAFDARSMYCFAFAGSCLAR